MDCEFCHSNFSNKQNLNAHQLKARYCLKIQNKVPTDEFSCDSCDKKFLSSTKLRRHEKNCSSKDLVVNLNNRIKELDNDIIIIKKDNDTVMLILQKEIDILRGELKKSQDRYDNLSITAVKRPTTSTRNVQINNYIKNMAPLLESDLTDNVHNLTLEHHSKGAEGYAEYALEFPFKDKIVCVDTARNKIKYKNADGDVVEDVGFRKMMVKLCGELKDRSFSLSQEHYEKLSDRFTEKEVEEYNFMEAAIAITKYASGRESDFCNQIVKMISKKSSK
jgi:hypothetical protein